MYNDLTFVEVIEDDAFPIVTELPDGSKRLFTDFGCYDMYNESKCVIFPKGKTTWEGFVPPCKFKDGDIIFKNHFVAIVSYIQSNGLIWYHGWYDIKYNKCKFENDYGIGNINDGDKVRFATEEEKQKLFDAIEANGFKWNPETNTLEKLIKPMFKINNIIRHKERKSNTRIVDIKDGNYIFKNGDIMPIYLQDNYEFVTDKFDINTLKPFESKVLVRNSYDGFWQPTFWGIYEAEKTKAHLHRYYLTTKGFFSHCIPYNEDTKHLLGTTNDCDDFYKTWEK
jgi:hypothetical protein